ncbi:MAG: MFS transporter [Actinobacteria bacterium]|nr:MFS transporter [Actinomycetota bacterium]
MSSLPRQFWLLVAGTFVYAVGVAMCYPFQTLYLNQRLGLSMTSVGLIIGVTLLAGLPFQIVGGAIADRFGRRPVLILAICAGMALFMGLGVAHRLWLVIALFAFEAALGFAQYLTATNAMVTDLTPLSRRAEAFSITRVSLNTGLTIGPLIAAPLIALDPTFRTSFLGASLVLGIFLLMVVTLFKETRPPAAGRGSFGSAFRGYGEVFRDRRMLAFCAVALLPLYAFGQVMVTMPIVLADVNAVSPGMWGILLVAYGASTAILQYPVVRILGRIDHMFLLALASLCIGVGAGSAAFVPWPFTFACLLAISLGVVLLVPISSTVVSNLAPTALRGRYMGFWTLIYIGGYALGPLLGGWALDALGSRGAFTVVAAAGLLGALLFPLLRTKAGARDADEDGTAARAALGGEPRGERPEQAL